MKTLIAFIKQAFSENGAASSTRILSGGTVVTMLGCIVYTVARTHALPANLGEAALVITSGFSGYAVNRFSRRDDGKDQNKTTGPTL
jgi:multisubunit Na+/H+ antiporter MnhG subunit